MRTSIPTTDAFRAPRIPVWATNLLLTVLLIALWPLNHLFAQYMDDYVLLIIIFIGVNIILATSLNLVIGITGQFSLGHAAFMAIGAYVTGILLRHYGIREPADGALDAMNVLRVVGILWLAGALASIGALLVGIPTLRLRGDYLAIATLGFGEIIYNLIITTEHIGPFYVGGSSGLHAIPIYRNTRFFWTFAMVVVCVVTVWRLVYSNKGRPSWPCAKMRSPPRPWGSIPPSTKSPPSPSARSSPASPAASRPWSRETSIRPPIALCARSRSS
jgi:ABC-type branched-subunit amino acid transport system permease subunit